MNLVVGNRVTYLDLQILEEGIEKTEIIIDNAKAYILEQMQKSKRIKILKVEACNWETIEFEEE